VVLHVFAEHGALVRRSLLEVLESYLIRRVIVGGAARDYGAVAAAVLERLATTQADPVSALRDQLAGYTTPDTAWPGDSDVLAFARDRSMAQIQARRIRLILSIVEQGLRTARHEPFAYDIDELTLEHLMPQAWNEHWRLADPATAMQRSRLVFTLGNLTLITGPLNSDLGNGPWARKRAALARYSLLLLNQSLPDVWDEGAIRARGEQFARILVRALPGPPTDVPRFAVGGPGGAGAADADPIALADDSAAADEDETLAEELEGTAESDVDAEAEAEAPGPPAVAPAAAVPRPRSAAVPPNEELMLAHIFEVLGAQPAGTKFTAGQFHRTASSVYPDRRPSQRAFAALIDSGTVSGLEITVNRSGHRAVKLARRRPTSRRPAR
jgi:hypothetical protein